MSGKEKSIGTIKVMDDAILTIASVAAAKVPGVFGMSSGIKGELAERFGRKSTVRGVRVHREEESISLDIYLYMNFGVCIPDVALEVQKEVKIAVEKLTGIPVLETNVHVQGINFPK